MVLKTNYFCLFKMSDNGREDNTSDNEITMLDPFNSEDIQGVPSKEDSVNNDVAKKRDTIFHPEILLNEPEEVTLIDTLDERDAPKSVEEEEGKENEEKDDDSEEITPVPNEKTSEEKGGEIDEITLEENLNEKDKVEKEEAVEDDEITLVDFEEEASEERKEGELLLAPRSRDNDHRTIRKKKQRIKKVFYISCVDFYRTQVRALPS